MIPLTNVQSGAEDNGTGSDFEQSPARHPPHRQHHQYAQLPQPTTIGSPPHHCYYRSPNSAAGGLATATGCDCHTSAGVGSLQLVSCSSSSPSAAKTVERRLVEAQWNGGSGCGGTAASCVGAAGGGGGAVRHRLMSPVGGSQAATTATKYGHSGAGLGTRLCNRWRTFGSRFRSQAQMVDVMSRVLFPMMFLVFNIVYWPFYLLF